MILNQKGFSAPILIIFVLLLLIIPVYYFMGNSKLQNKNQTPDIKGTSSDGTLFTTPGFSVSVVSNSETWDLIEFLCKDLQSCTTSLNSGNRLGTVSGGQTDLHEVVVSYTKDWSDYEYIKFYVRPGTFNQDISTNFKVLSLGDIPNSQVSTISDGITEYEVIIAPVKPLSQAFYTSGVFSDN